jgi:hypothetical protein
MSGNALKKAHQVLAEKRANGSFTQGNPLSNGLDSTSLRASIDAHCYMCMGGEKEGKTKPSVMRGIRECNSPVCPLNNVRLK